MFPLAFGWKPRLLPPQFTAENAFVNVMCKYYLCCQTYLTALWQALQYTETCGT
jgi:hypothetical protein